MLCNRCGSENEGNAKYCIKCGLPLDPASTEKENAQPLRTSAELAQARQSAQQSSNSQKDQNDSRLHTTTSFKVPAWAYFTAVFIVVIYLVSKFGEHQPSPSPSANGPVPSSNTFDSSVQQQTDSQTQTEPVGYLFSSPEEFRLKFNSMCQRMHDKLRIKKLTPVEGGFKCVLNRLNKCVQIIGVTDETEGTVMTVTLVDVCNGDQLSDLESVMVWTDIMCTCDSSLPAKLTGEIADVEEALGFAKFVNCPTYDGIATKDGVEYTSSWSTYPVAVLFLSATRIGNFFPYPGATRQEVTQYASDHSSQIWTDKGYDLFFLVMPKIGLGIDFFKNSDIVETTTFVNLKYLDNYDGASEKLQDYAAFASDYCGGAKTTWLSKDNFGLSWNDYKLMGLVHSENDGHCFLLFVIASDRRPSEARADFVKAKSPKLQYKIFVESPN